MDEHGGLLPPASYGAVDAHSETADAHYGDDEARIAMAQSEREKEGHADDHRRKAESRRTVCVSRGMGLAGVMVIVGAVGYMNPDLMNHAQDVLGDMRESSTVEVVESSSLSFGCSNEYPVPGSLQFYANWTHVVEPWRNTTLTATGALHGSTLEWEVTYTREGDDSVRTLPVYSDGSVSTTGSSATEVGQQSSFVAPHAGQWYDITLTEHRADGKVAVATGRALGKYVRREIRSLTEEDRLRYFDALTEVHRLGLEEGQAKYSAKFANQEVFLNKHLAQDTLTQCNFFHGCAGFLTGHAAFQLQFEQSLQAIDPSIAAPYWDPSVDDTVYGRSWYEESPVVTNDWFGPQEGNPDNNYILDEGRFAYTVIPTDATAAEHNAYGRLTQTYNNDPAQYVWRSASVCGLPSEVRLPGCTALKGMLEKDNLDDFREKMETDWHGTLHPSMGGAVDCPYSFTDLLTPHPEWSELLEFVSMLTEVVWDVSHATGTMVCPSVCSDETPFEECSCSCPGVDLEALNRSTAYTFLDELGVLDRYYGCQRGPRFMNYTEPDWDPEFVSPVSKAVSDSGGKEQDRIKGMYLFQLNETYTLSEEEQGELLVWLSRAACHPGRVSPFMTPLAATNDPLFWVAHASFERIWAAKRLLPEFKDSFDQRWDYNGESDCYGRNYDDEVPFRDFMDEESRGMDPTKRYTQRELVTLFDPTSERLQYMFDDLEWSHCS